MKHFLILHGTDGSPNANWFMWLKGVLIGMGYRVWLPQLPDAEAPDAKKYTEFLLSNKSFVYDEETVVVGHSSGAVEVLHLLQNLPEGTKIKAAVLVAAFKDDLGWESLRGMFEEKLDFDAIKKHCGRFVFLHSDDDPYCPVAHAEYLASKTGGELALFEGQGHFNTEASHSYRQFPALLDIVKEIL